MPKQIWTRITGSGYTGQVLSAGVLLAVISLLLFTVISTLLPAARLPLDKPPVAENPPLAENGPTKVQPVTEAVVPGTQQQVPAGQSQAIAQEAATVATDTAAAGNDAIHDLWQGTQLQEFGWQVHPLYKDWRYHPGIDIGGREGQIVPALLPGEVVDLYTDRQYGLTVVVRSGSYTVYYGALASTGLQKNSSIKAGRPIGSMGLSFSEREPHLHLAVKKDSGQDYINPRELFPDIPR